MADEHWAARQVLELESLRAIYFEEGVVRFDEDALETLKAEPPCPAVPLALSVRLPCMDGSGADTAGLRLAAVLPHGYPQPGGEGPTLWLEPEFDLSGDGSSQLRAVVADDEVLCAELQAAAREMAAGGEECLLPLVLRAADLVRERLEVLEGVTMGSPTVAEDDEQLALALFEEELSLARAPSTAAAAGPLVLGRRAMFSHHIIAASKRQAISEWAAQLDLGGLAKIGWPGVIIVEGEERNVRAYVDALSRLRWKHFVVRGEQTEEVPDARSLDALRCMPRRMEQMGPDESLGDFAARCRQCGVEELFLACLKLQGSTGSKAKARPKR